MKSAVITPCSHFFHAACLKKWLYVQETCPLCHGQLKSQLQPISSPGAAIQGTPPANQNPAEVEQDQSEQQIELDTEEGTPPANKNPAEVKQEQSEPQIELDTEEGTQGKNTPPMITSAEPEFDKDSLSGSSKECDVVTDGSAGPAGGLDDHDDDGSCSTSDVQSSS